MFDRVLCVPAEGQGRRRVRFLASALALHGALIGAAFLASLFAVGVIQEPVRPDFSLVFYETPKAPEIDLSKPKRRYEIPTPSQPAPPPEPPKVAAEAPKRIEFKPQMPEPDVEIPKNLAQQKAPELKLQQLPAALSARMDAPEPAATGTTRAAARPATGLAAGPAGGARLSAAMDAPEVVVPGGGRGGPGLPAREAGLAVRAGGGGGSIVAYKTAGDPTFFDSVVPPPGPAGKPGGKPGGLGLIHIAGNGAGGGAGSGGRGLKYGDGPADAPGGQVGSFGLSGRPGGGSGGGGGTHIDGVRAALASKYGLPFVSVNDLGQRSTEAARWNLLLPQLSDLLRVALRRGTASGAAGEVVAVERTGDSLMIRYRDGVVHVLVPTDDGLAALYVARGAGARPVVSKVQEAESALDALSRLTRGAS